MVVRARQHAAGARHAPPADIPAAASAANAAVTAADDIPAPDCNAQWLTSDQARVP